MMMAGGTRGWEPVAHDEGCKTYARVEADALGVHANIGELDKLLKLDGQRRHDAGIIDYQGESRTVESILLAMGVDRIIVW